MRNVYAYCKEYKERERVASVQTQPDVADREHEAFVVPGVPCSFYEKSVSESKRKRDELHTDTDREAEQHGFFCRKKN